MGTLHRKKIVPNRPLPRPLLELELPSLDLAPVLKLTTQVIQSQPHADTTRMVLWISDTM